MKKLSFFHTPFLYVPCGTSSCLPGRGMAGSVSPGETHYIYKEKFIKR